MTVLKKCVLTGGGSERIFVTVHTGLCIGCTDRKKMIQECKNPIAEGNFPWIFAGYWSRSEQ